MVRTFFKKQDCQRGGWIWKNFNGPTAIGPFPIWQKTQPNSDGQSMEQRHMNRHILIPKIINFIQFPHQGFAQNLTGTKSFGMVQWNYRFFQRWAPLLAAKVSKQWGLREGDHRQWMTMDIWVSNLGTSNVWQETSTSRDKQTALGHHLQQWLNIMNRSRFSRYVWPPINHGFSYFWSPNGAGDDWDANDFAQEP